MQAFPCWGCTSFHSCKILYFAHPEARYFTVGRVGRDQVTDYAARKQMSLTEVERWLAPNLSYERDTVAP